MSKEQICTAQGRERRKKIGRRENLREGAGVLFRRDLVHGVRDAATKQMGKKGKGEGKPHKETVDRIRSDARVVYPHRRHTTYVGH